MKQKEFSSQEPIEGESGEKTELALGALSSSLGELQTQMSKLDPEKEAARKQYIEQIYLNQDVMTMIGLLAGFGGPMGYAYLRLQELKMKGLDNLSSGGSGLHAAIAVEFLGILTVGIAYVIKEIRLRRISH